MKTTPEQRRKGREWKLANKERVLESGRTYREKNRENIKKYYDENRERFRIDQKNKRLMNPEEFNRKRREKRASRVEVIRARERAARVKNPAYWHLKGVKRRAKGADLACDLDMNWINDRLNRGVCELSGIQFDMDRSTGGFSMMKLNGPTVDRKNPKGPYTKANCRMILWWLNRALSDKGEEYALSVFRAIFIKRGEISDYEDRMAA